MRIYLGRVHGSMYVSAESKAKKKFPRYTNIQIKPSYHGQNNWDVYGYRRMRQNW